MNYKNRLKKKLLVALAVVMSTTMMIGCGQSSTTSSNNSDTIKIGIVTPLTGDCSQDGVDIKKASEFAIKEVNDAGGINGKKLELVTEDDKADPKEAAIVANKLAQDKSIVGVVGHYTSSCSLAGAPIYNKAGVVEVSPASSAPSLSQAGDYTFRIVNSDLVQGALVANWAVSEKGFKKVSIIYENSDYGLGNAKAFEDAAVEKGATIVTKDSYLSGQTKDFTSILTNIKNSGSDVVFIGGLYNECAMILKQAKQIGVDIPFMGTDAVYSLSLPKIAGDAAENFLLIGTFHEENNTEISKKFVKGYTDYSGNTPGTYAANAYDATRVVIEGIENAGTDRKAVRDYIAKIKDFPGVGGIITFDENGDVVKQPLKLTVKDGKFVICEK